KTSRAMCCLVSHLLGPPYRCFLNCLLRVVAQPPGVQALLEAVHGITQLRPRTRNVGANLLGLLALGRVLHSLRSPGGLVEPSGGWATYFSCSFAHWASSFSDATV